MVAGVEGGSGAGKGGLEEAVACCIAEDEGAGGLGRGDEGKGDGLSGRVREVHCGC